MKCIEHDLENEKDEVFISFLHIHRKSNRTSQKTAKISTNEILFWWFLEKVVARCLFRSFSISLFEFKFERIKYSRKCSSLSSIIDEKIQIDKSRKDCSKKNELSAWSIDENYSSSIDMKILFSTSFLELDVLIEWYFLSFFFVSFVPSRNIIKIIVKQNCSMFEPAGSFFSRILMMLKLWTESFSKMKYLCFFPQFSIHRSASRR